MGTKTKSTKALKAFKTTALKAATPKAAAAKKTGMSSAGSPNGKSATKARQPTKSDLLEEAAELLTRIETAETACQCARLELDDAREGVKCAKQNYGACVDELRKLARARKEKHPLFEAAGNPKAGNPKADAKTSTPSIAATLDTLAPGESGSTPTTNDSCDDSWKKLSIHAAAFTDAQGDALESADVRTLGELQAAMNRHGQWWAKELKIHGRHQQGIEGTFNEYLTKFSGSECAAGNVKAVAEDAATDGGQDPQGAAP